MGTAPRTPGETGKLKRETISINGGSRMNITVAIQYGTINVSSVLPKKIYNKLSLSNFVYAGDYGFSTDQAPNNNFAVFTPTEFNHDTGILSYRYQSTYDGFITYASFKVFYIE